MTELTWQSLLSKEKKLIYFKNILNTINIQKRAGIVIYPKKKDIFNAFRYTALQSIKVVIVGQDPYHGPNQAHGLAFSVLPGITLPPSLKNIFKELQSDLPNFTIPKHGCLNSWAQKGVFLLNSILTVQQGKSFSHSNIGWEQFTDKIINILNIHRKNIVFLLWGNYAKKKGNIIDNKKHHILQTSHPSPLSAQYGFLGCKHFSKTNIFLQTNNQPIINWQI